MGWNIEYAEVGWLKNMPTSLTTRKLRLLMQILVVRFDLPTSKNVGRGVTC